VTDLERSLAFYRAMGLHSPGVIGAEYLGDEDNPAGEAAMFELDDGFILSLYPRTELAKDAGVEPDRITGSPIALGYFAESREEVDDMLEQAARAAGTVHGPTHERPWGIYAGHFSDPDGHMWEVLYFIARGGG
jgi:catechol 2,3-dioxygenase-like lactoylglutathione lyase family enzyme